MSLVAAPGRAPRGPLQWLLDPRQRGGAPAPSFDPATLFSGGESGTWLEQAATHSFTSTATLTNPTATNTAGLWISRDGGAGYSGSSFTGLGSEIVSNAGGPFVDTTDWTPASATLSVVSGNLRISGTGTFARASISLSGLTVGALYVFEIELVATDGSDTSIWVNTGFGSQPIVEVLTPQVLEFAAVATATTGTLILYTSRSSDGTGENSDWAIASIKEIPGNHAIQGTAAARPTLQTGTPAFLRDDTVDDALNWTAPTDTDYTIARLNSAGTVTIATGQSLSGATDIFLEQDIAAYLAVNRALTGAETTGLTAYLEALS